MPKEKYEKPSLKRVESIVAPPSSFWQSGMPLLYVLICRDCGREIGQGDNQEEMAMAAAEHAAREHPAEALGARRDQEA